jgi:hypothetical protein
LKKALFILLMLTASQALSQAWKVAYVDSLKSWNNGYIILSPTKFSMNGSKIDSAKVRTDSLSIYSDGIAYNAYKNAPSGGGTTSTSWWEIDGQGNMMPRKSGGEGDTYWELDAQGNLRSKAW